MHRRFRFCALAALISALHFPVATASAQTEPEAQEAALPMPTPGKHRLKASPLEVLQHLAEHQAKESAAHGKQLDALETETAAQSTRMAELSTKVDGLREENAVLRQKLQQAIELLETLQRTAVATPRVETRRAELAPPPAAEAAAPPAAEPAEPEPAPHTGPTHTVARGENLTSIARQHGTTVAELVKLNQIKDERRLQIGQTLKIPAASPTP